MKFLKSFILGGLLVSVMTQLWASQTLKIDQTDPVKLVDTVSRVVITELDRQREVLKQDPKKVQAFAEQYVLPYVDTQKMARYVMGRYWRQASSSQQQAFIQAFTQTLLRSYANSMLNLKITSFEVTGSQSEGKRGNRMLVSAMVKQADGNETKVQYRVYQDKTTKLWRLYDVIIENISMLLNYRKTYASAFQQKGIDGVIAEMQAKNKSFN